LQLTSVIVSLHRLSAEAWDVDLSQLKHIKTWSIDLSLTTVTLLTPFPRNNNAAF